MPPKGQALEFDVDSLGKALGPGGLHEFLDQAIVQPVLQREAGAVHRQQQIGAEANQGACISPKGLFALERRYDAFAFHDIIQAEGLGEVQEGQVMDDLDKKMGGAVVIRSKPRRSSIIVPATKYTRLPLTRYK